MAGPFEDRIYLEMILSKSMETDENGNPIIYAEASNENLDQQEQIVLQRALLESKDYFLKNGVISYDHKHLRRDPSDPDWNPEKYIIGEPIAVEKRGTKTFVKARLFQSNPIVKELVSKLKDGAKYIRTSVGGLRPILAQEFDAKFKRPIEKVVSVMWNELAITPRPVNDSMSPVTLSSAAFVKSLSMGYTTDSAIATGGAALGVQDLEGAHKCRKKAIHAVVTAIAVGDVKTPQAGIEVLAENGVNSKEASDILEEVVNRRKQIQEVFRMDANLTKSFDEAIEELEKAMKGAPAMPPAPIPAPKPHAEPDGDEEGGPGDGDEDDMGEPKEKEGEGEGDEGVPPVPPMPPMKKSGEEEYEYLDVSPILAEFSKSLKGLRGENKALAEMVKSQGETLKAQSDLIKSMGNMQLQSAQVLKSITDTPAMRKSVVSKQPRFVDTGAGRVEMSAGEILRKSTIALNREKITLRQASIIEDRVNKGLEIDQETLSMLKSIN